ncbi:response regulator [Planctomycetota bacterium]
MTNGKQVRLLLVEDDVDFADALVMRLKRREFDITTAASGEAGLDILKGGAVFDVVVSDIRLPEMDGMEFLSRVRELENDVPVVLLTGYGNLESAQKAVRLDASDYLLKPLESIDDLLDPIGKAVESYQLKIENQRLLDSLREKMKELEISEEKLDSIMRVIPDIVYRLDEAGDILFISDAVKALGYDPAGLVGGPITEILHAEDRERFERFSLTPADRTDDLPGLFGRKGSSRTRELVVRLVHGGKADYVVFGEVFSIGTVGVIRDATERIRLEKELVEAGERVQRDVGRDLHDGVCQYLTGIACMGTELVGRLRARSAAETASAEKLLELVDEVNGQTRSLAAGLCPVRLESTGFGHALGELAANLSDMFGIRCDVVCEEDIDVGDSGTATHLYRIAQEAANNAIKHGKATEIDVTARTVGGKMVLDVKDNGKSYGGEAVSSAGMGSHIIKHRAELIGAKLEVGPLAGGGTILTCSLGSNRDATQTEME